MEAEALAFEAATLCALQLYRPWLLLNNVDALRLVFQLDNLPIVHHLNGQAKCTMDMVSQRLEHIKRNLAQHTASLSFDYIPRESNYFADYAAGLASKRLLHHLEGTSDPAQHPLPGIAQAYVLDEDFDPLPNHEGPPAPSVPIHLSPPSYQSDYITLPAPPWTSLTLPEKPSLTPLLATQLHAKYPHLRTHPATSSYLRALGHLPAHELLLRPTYTVKRGARLYASAPCAQQLPKQVRLLLFGQTHHELDLVAAQFNIFLWLTTRSLVYQGKTVHQWRLFFTDLIAGTPLGRTPGAIKKLFNIFLNTSADKVLHIIQKTNLFVHEPLRNFFRALDSLRGTLLAAAEPYGFHRLNSHTEANVHYFALEHVEQLFIQQFLHQLCQHLPITSGILLHDGFLFASQHVTAGDIHIIIQRTCCLSQLPLFPLDFHALAHEWELNCKPLLAGLQHTRENKRKNPPKDQDQQTTPKRPRVEQKTHITMYLTKKRVWNS